MSQINISAIKTPGVYVNEIPAFPPSIAQVATAVPCFIGYTAMATQNGNNVYNMAVRISSLHEFIKYFGTGFQDLQANVFLNQDNSVNSVYFNNKSLSSNIRGYQLFNAMQMFFNNGGGNCYIIALPVVSDSPSIEDFLPINGDPTCLDILRKQAESTLIVIPDAVMLANKDFNTLMNLSLDLCGALEDRFTILDVYNGDQDRDYSPTDVINVFRNSISGQSLNYGAAYYPWLSTSLIYTPDNPGSVDYENIVFYQAPANSGTPYFPGNIIPPALAPVPLNAIITNNPILTQLDNEVVDSELVLNSFNYSIGNFAPSTAAVPPTAPVSISQGGNNGDVITVITSNPNTIYSANYSAPPDKFAAKVAKAINAASATNGGYTASADGTNVTVTAPLTLGAAANLIKLNLTDNGSATGSTITFSGGSLSTSATGTFPIPVIAVGNNLSVILSNLPIGTHTIVAGDDTNETIVAINIAAAINSISAANGGYTASASGPRVTVTAPVSLGLAAGVSLSCTVTGAASASGGSFSGGSAATATAQPATVTIFGFVVADSTYTLMVASAGVTTSIGSVSAEAGQTSADIANGLVSSVTDFNTNFSTGYTATLSSTSPNEIIITATGGAVSPVLSGLLIGGSVSDAYLNSLLSTPPQILNQTDLGNTLDTIENMLLGLVYFKPTDTVPAQTGNATIRSIHANCIEASTEGSTNYTPIEVLIRQLLLINSSYPVLNGSSQNQPASANISTSDFAAWNYNLANIEDTIPSIYGTATTDPAASINVTKTVVALYNNVIKYILNFSTAITKRMEGLEQQLIASSTVYANIKTAIANEGIVTPVAAAMAGIYAAVDGSRGVWKAPANVALNTVIEPTVVIDDNMQGDLNIDVNAGKSVNAIRAFTGKGVIVWGARTLTGNDNDFRYVPVRRFFIMVEESVKLAAFQFVFEPNVATTWMRVQAMIENYLTNLWRQGALAGAKPETSFFVSVGLGKTMTFQDVLEGRMIVTIGLAPVRPAEFIILNFTQIQQTS